MRIIAFILAIGFTVCNTQSLWKWSDQCGSADSCVVVDYSRESCSSERQTCPRDADLPEKGCDPVRSCCCQCCCFYNAIASFYSPKQEFYDEEPSYLEDLRNNLFVFTVFHPPKTDIT